MVQRYPSVVIVVMFALLFSCVKEREGDRNLVKVGSSVLKQSDMNAFTNITGNHPAEPPEFTLFKRLPITGFIECASIYEKVRFNTVNLRYRFSRDWQWKKRYIIAVNFMTDVLQRHLGYSEKELRKYYAENRPEFMSAVLYDSAGVTCTTSVITPFEADVKRQIAEKLFFRDNPPDSAFLAEARFPLNDENVIEQRWIKYIRYEGYRKFFLNRFFKKKYGTAYSDSSMDIIGKNAILSQENVDVIVSWMSAQRQHMLRDNNRQTVSDLKKLMIRWYLFSERAKATKYALQPKIKSILKWLWRYEVAQRYINDVIGPAVKKEVSIDSVMALYSYRDEYDNSGRIVDTVRKNEYFKRLLERQTMVLYDERLDSIRRDAGVTFLDGKWGDGKNSDPAELLRRADSLRERDDAARAEELYRTLADGFPFAGEGKKALVEMAKLQTDKKFYTEAIKNYRRALVTGDADADERCSIMFMIGFIYDEYLNRLDMAEFNYKWVLKNAPGCGYADEAEFMMLHLGERTESAEELQAEAIRQGKNKKTSSADSTAVSIKSEQVKKTSFARLVVIPPSGGTNQGG